LVKKKAFAIQFSLSYPNGEYLVLS
jgi:hypothetical protein